MIWLGAKLTAREEISAQIMAERDTHPIGYSDFVLLWRALPSNERDLSLFAGPCAGKYFMGTQIDPKSSLTGTGSSFSSTKHCLLIREQETVSE